MPAGAADATQTARTAKAKPNPWLAYFPAKGVTCTSTMTDPTDGSTMSNSVTVVAKSGKSIVLHETGAARITEILLPHGRRREATVQKVRLSGIRERISVAENYPSPAGAVAHAAATGRITMLMTLSAREAKSVLTSGRSLTVTAKVRAVGAGSRTISLADPAATSVNAIGVRTQIKSARLSGNAKPAFARFMKHFMGSLFSTMTGTEWFAPGRGTVLQELNLAGTALTATQTGCS